MFIFNRSIAKEKLLLNIDKNNLNENNCWEWMGSRDKNGYGKIKISGKNLRAHRLAALVWSHLVKNGYSFNINNPRELICHSCDNPPCINPHHLWVGTVKQNTIDMVEKGRNPYRKGESSPLSKLKEKDIYTIEKLRGDDNTHGQIADKFNISKSQVARILQNKRWSHIERENIEIPKKYKKFSKDDVIFIRTIHKIGVSQKYLSEIYGCSKWSIMNIVNGNWFSDLPGPIKKRKKIDNKVIEKFLELYKVEMSIPLIAEHLNISRTSAYRIYYKFLKE